MAFITPAEVKEIRKAIKARFPKHLKFSITTKNYSTVSVRLMEGPATLGDDGQYNTVNHYSFSNAKGEEAKAFWKEVVRIILTTKPCEDHSDYYSDYVDVDYYYDIGSGRWDKPYKVVA